MRRLSLLRRVFTIEFKAEVARHKKAGNPGFAGIGRKFDVLPKRVQRWEKQYAAGQLTVAAGRRAISPEQAENLRLRAELSTDRWLVDGGAHDERAGIGGTGHGRYEARPQHGLIFHSDRGSQYASRDTRNWLNQRDIRPSMSGTGNCYDNAPMESFWHSLKVEATHGQHFATRDEARHSVFAYIEGWYNTTRMHSSLGYQSPAQFERAWLETSNAANDEPINQNSPTARLNKKAA